MRGFSRAEDAAAFTTVAVWIFRINTLQRATLFCVAFLSFPFRNYKVLRLRSCQQSKVFLHFWYVTELSLCHDLSELRQSPFVQCSFQTVNQNGTKKKSTNLGLAVSTEGNRALQCILNLTKTAEQPWESDKSNKAWNYNEKTNIIVTYSKRHRNWSY